MIEVISAAVLYLLIVVHFSLAERKTNNGGAADFLPFVGCSPPRRPKNNLQNKE
jgi:hypothetical protein